MGPGDQASGGTRLGRRALGAAAGSLVLALATRASAEQPVPVPLQVKLLVKVAGYDRNLPARAQGKVRIALVVKPGDAESERTVALARSSLAEVESIAGLPIEVLTETWASAAALQKAVVARKLAVVYLAPGLAPADVEAVGRALAGGDVLSATAVPTDVPRGVVLGFDLVSGKPKLVIHLGQAKKQRVDLPADVLRLGKVVE